jgi:hypothetical protein
MSMEQPATTQSSSGLKLDQQFLRRHISKVLIQEAATRRYWQSAGVWTADAAKASNFASYSAALEQATRLKLRNVQVILTHYITECEVIPLEASFKL